MCVFVYVYECGLNARITVVSGTDPVPNVSWIAFQEERSSELRLRRGVEQAAHTFNNPQVKCTGVLL